MLTEESVVYLNLIHHSQTLDGRREELPRSEPSGVRLYMWEEES